MWDRGTHTAIGAYAALVSETPDTVLICPGQGAQRAGGVSDLATEFSDLSSAGQHAFRLASEIADCDVWRLGISLDSSDEDALQQPSLLQPYLVAWAIEEHASIAPRLGPLRYVTGHSSGMNSAMALSGALSLEAALRFAWQCGLSMDRDCEERPGGLLALVGAGREAAESIAAQSGASLANHNAPDQTVLGGSFDALERASALAAGHDCQAVPLRVAGAFHTPSFAPSDDLNRPFIDELPIASSFTPILGNRSGQIIETADQLRAELRGQYVRPVEWLAVLNTLHAHGVERFVSLGPGNVMAGLVRRFAKGLPGRIQIKRAAQLKHVPTSTNGDPDE